MAENEILLIQNIGRGGDDEFIERRLPLSKGALITGDTEGAPKLVAPGPDGYILVSSDDGEEGVKWAINESAIHVSIWADKGTTFVNGVGEIILKAYVFQGAKDITDKIAQNLFSWTRISFNTAGDAIWTAQHKSVGNTIVITPADVVRSAMFSAEVLIEQGIYNQ